MSFKLPGGAKDWFKELEHGANPLQIEFDRYYFCLVIGLASRREESNDGVIFVDYWVAKYEPVSRLLIAQLVLAEVRKLGISLTERESVQKQARRLLQHNSATTLSDEGMKLMNQYAAGGYHELREHIIPKPYEMSVFLRLYIDHFSTIEGGD